LFTKKSEPIKPFFQIIKDLQGLRKKFKEKYPKNMLITFYTKNWVTVYMVTLLEVWVTKKKTI
jgi:hypothetical protein